MSRTVIAFLLICMAIGSSEATAQKVEITPFVGYRFGGDFYDKELELEFDLKNSLNFGFAFDYAVSDNFMVEFLYSRQGTELSAGEERTTVFELNIDYFHGGVLFQGGSEGLKPYVVGGVGATLFNPKVSDIDSQTRFSVGLGAGVKGLVGGRVGYRFEFRSIPTFVDKGQEDEFCHPTAGCITWTSASVFWQSQFTGGVTIAF